MINDPFPAYPTPIILDPDIPFYQKACSILALVDDNPPSYAIDPN